MGKTKVIFKLKDINKCVISFTSVYSLSYNMIFNFIVLTDNDASLSQRLEYY